MHVERLLAEFIQAAPLKCPSVDRVCSAGYLTQWLREHLEFGGNNPKIVSREQLLEDGVPLQQSQARSQKRKTNPRAGEWTRPHLLYANEEYVKAKRRRETNKEPRHTRDEYQALIKKFSDDFSAMSIDAQRVWVRDAKLRSMELQYGRDDLENLTEFDRGNIPNWGLSSRDMPLSEEIAERVIKRECGIEEISGLTSISPSLRKAFRDFVFVREHGC